MGKKVYIKTALTGGGDTALDGIDGSDLNHEDIGIVMAAGIVYFYLLNHDSSTAESSPGTISPDKNYGTKRWALQNFIVSSAQVRHIDGRESLTATYDTLFLQYSAAGKGVTIGDAGTDHPLFVYGDVSGASITDRTKYPESTKQAYDALASMTAKEGQVDHDKLDPFIKGAPNVDKDGKETPTRDIGAVVSCQAVVIQDLITRVEKLEKN